MIIKRRTFIGWLRVNGYDDTESADLWDDLKDFIEEEKRSEEEIKLCLEIKNQAAKDRIRNKLLERINDKEGLPPL